MRNLHKPFGSIKTEWEIVTYDVWGNERDGFEVNQAFRSGKITLFAPVTIYNYGTSGEFRSASLNDKQIKLALNIKPRVHIDTDGDDLIVYVNHRSTGKPLGELRCISHESLSPIKPKEEKLK